MIGESLHLDVESFSTVDLTAQGAYVYWEHPVTDVWLVCYAFDDEPVETWWPGDPVPERVRKHIEDGGEIVAWNAQFERLCFRHCLTPRHGWPKTKLEQFRCVMVEAYAAALPGKLEQAAPALGLNLVKDNSGYLLMKRMCRPKKLTKCPRCYGAADPECACCDGNGEIAEWYCDDEKLLRLEKYCGQDVEVERLVEKQILRLSPEEREIYLLDQKINDRGVLIDEVLANRCLEIVEQTTKKLNAEMKAATGGLVTKCSEVSNIMEWLHSTGCHPDDLTGETVEEMLGGWDLTPEQRKVISLRQEAAKTSTAKIKKALQMRCKDGRMRGNLQYHGANTGRWAGRGMQLQNLTRPVLGCTDEIIESILDGTDLALLRACYGPPMTCVADSIRGVIVAKKGCRIIASDFTSIEAIVNPCLAGQQNVVEAYRNREDVYCKNASDIYGMRIAKKEHPEERQLGKVMELSLGFGGGAAALAKMAGKYRIKLEPLFDRIWGLAPDERREKAEYGYAQRGRSSQLSEKAWLTAEVLKLTWREANPNVVRWWSRLEDAAIEAVGSPGSVVECGQVAYRKLGSFLLCKLPSGRVLSYPYAKLVKKEMPWKDSAGNKVFKDSLVYKGVNSVSHKWEEKSGYGGLLCENITQAVARDIMAGAMLRAEAAGYPVTITIHDEVVAEVPIGHGSVEEFDGILIERPVWAATWPIMAEGWEGPRYKK